MGSEVVTIICSLCCPERRSQTVTCNWELEVYCDKWFSMRMAMIRMLYLCVRFLVLTFRAAPGCDTTKGSVLFGSWSSRGTFYVWVPEFSEIFPVCARQFTVTTPNLRFIPFKTHERELFSLVRNALERSCRHLYIHGEFISDPKINKLYG